MSVCSDAESLFEFVHRSTDTSVMTKRRALLVRFGEASQALWWIEAGHVRTVDEALNRLRRLDRYGRMREAFTLKMRSPAPASVSSPVEMKPDPWHPGRA